jgi:hypothetical protein
VQACVCVCVCVCVYVCVRVKEEPSVVLSPGGPLDKMGRVFQEASSVVVVDLRCVTGRQAQGFGLDFMV